MNTSSFDHEPIPYLDRRHPLGKSKWAVDHQKQVTRLSDDQPFDPSIVGVKGNG
ncbi:MAG: hypothetical protein AB1898_18045 [Acidobacteriota bacterium]